MTVSELPFTTVTVGTAKKKRTQVEFHNLPEGPPYFELEDGHLREMSRPELRHQKIVAKLLIAVSRHMEAHQSGEIWSEVEVDILATKTYVPDLTFLSKQHFAQIEDGKRIVGAPDLVVEVLSSNTASRDQTIKLKTYQQAGVPWYWIVDPEDLVILEHKHTSEGYLLSQIIIPPEPFSPGIFPGLTFNLAELMGETKWQEGTKNE